MLLGSMVIFSREATACTDWAVGPSSFVAAPGGSQTLVWTAHSSIGRDIVTITVSAGSNVFSVSQMPFDILADSATFTVTFKPGRNDTGTIKGTLACPCGRTYQIVGTVATSGVANALPSNVSFTMAPNPATDNVHLIVSGVRTAEIGIFDLLGKEVASSKATTWRWDASSIATGAYMVRIVGESNSGEEFAIWRRIIIAR